MVGLDMIDEIPFPALIIEENRLIRVYNECFESVLNIRATPSLHVEEVFQIWESEENSNLIFASCRDKHFLFLKQEIKDSTNALYIGIENDEISKLRRKMKDLEVINRELDAIIDNSYDGIYITDNKGITLKTNAAIERITGIPKKYYIGKNVDTLIHRGILKSSVTHKVLQQKRTVSLVQDNFEGRETLITGNPVFNEDGEIEKVVTNIRDLSELNELQAQLRKANKLSDKYKKELERLKGAVGTKDGIAISSSSLKVIFEMADRIADVDATVLILGETGVGKDVLAKHIFDNSKRSQSGQFIKVNCGAIPSDLLESELFGYESGAFTGANTKGKAGMFEVADKGMLFLDEIGELSLSLQVKLLRVLQERDIQRIGGTKSKKVDVRVIAATNRNLKEMVNKGEFREDLFYRLNVIPIMIPPLRERRDDILPLMQLFLANANEKYGAEKRFDAKLKDYFYTYDWPGNVRELSNLVERLVLTTQEECISIENLPNEYQESTDDNISFSKIVSLKKASELAEEKILALAVQKYKNTYQIAEALETSQPTVVRKLKKYNLKL
jgi:PAS domain S-box-containing protein